jgi:hypothetical protein
MDRLIGFSTGALALSDYNRALNLLNEFRIGCVELSALRQRELAPLITAIDELDLSSFEYISFHAPSTVVADAESEVVDQLLTIADRGWPIIVHPDVITDYSAWRHLDSALCIENMDRRKQVGRTADELLTIFDHLPTACLCFDIGHARQIDTTMTEAYYIVQLFRSKLRQVHVSEVNTRSKHDPLSYAALLAFQPFGTLIPQSVPLIIEAVIDSAQITSEVARVREAFSGAVESTRNILGRTTEDLILLETEENISVRLAAGSVG